MTVTKREWSSWGGLAIILLGWCLRNRPVAPAVQRRLGAAGVQNPNVLNVLRRRNIESLLYLSCDLNSPVQSTYDAVWRVQREAFFTFLEELRCEGVEAVVFKGVEFIERAFGSRAIGFIGDADILVKHASLDQVRVILGRLGYRQAFFDRRAGALVDFPIWEITNVETKHYELVAFRRLQRVAIDKDQSSFASASSSAPLQHAGGDTFVVVTIDIHHGLMVGLPTEQMFERAVPSALGEAYTFCETDHVWFTLSRYYREVARYSERSLRPLAYAAKTLQSANIDWEILLRAAREHELGPPLYYTLTFLDLVSDTGFLPPEVRRELEPGRGSSQFDFGEQVQALFSEIPTDPTSLREFVSAGLDG